MDTIPSGSGVISQLNLISTQQRILMRFEKHPHIPTSVMLHFGHKCYEGQGRSIKESRMLAAREAYKEYKAGVVSSTSEETSYQTSPISQVYEISQRLNKKITVEYAYNQQDSTQKQFKCTVSFADFQITSNAMSKKRAKEICFEQLWNKLVEKDKPKALHESSGHGSGAMSSDHAANSEASDSSLQSEVSDIVPRDYQEEIFNKGVDSNIIICLGTGTGKTFIAVLLIRKFAAMAFNSTGQSKKILFLAPTVALVTQQSTYLSRHTCYKIGRYYGSSSESTWDAEKWKKEISMKQILVITPELCRQLLQHAVLRISDICLIIFDECHHGINKGHPYNIIMTLYFANKDIDPKNVPRIIGLSASPALTSTIEKYGDDLTIEHCIDTIENIYQAKCITVIEYVESLKRMISNPKINVVLYKNNPKTPIISSIEIYICKYKTKLDNFCGKFVTNLCTNSPYPILKNRTTSESPIIGFVKPSTISPQKMHKYTVSIINRCLIILNEFGIYPLLCYLDISISLVDDVMKKIDYRRFIPILEKLGKYLKKIHESVNFQTSRVIDMIQVKSMENLCDTELLSGKLVSLITLLCKCYPSSSNPAENEQILCSTIVFALERSTCSILSMCLNRLAVMESQSKRMPARFCCNYVVGVSDVSAQTKLRFGLSEMNLKVVNSRIQAFHTGAFHVLFATNVLEEGIDVRRCNVVIRFDKFSSFHSFIQSKGRIRRQNSSFYVIENEANAAEVNHRISKFLEVENRFYKIMDKNSREEDNIIETADDQCHELPTEEQVFSTPLSRIDLRSSIGYVYRYCNQFSKDCNYTVSPRYFFEKSDGKVRCNLRLPYESTINEVISSDWVDDTKIARQQSSLRAIKMLYDKCLIDDSFLPSLPVLSKKLEENLKFEKEPINEDTCYFNIETYQPPKNFYLKSLPKLLTHQTSKNVFHCYHVHFSDYSVCKSKEKLLNSIDLSFHDFGLLVPNKIPNISFPLASTANNLQISITSYETHSISLTPQEMDLVGEFNKMIYENLLDIMPKTCFWDMNNCYYFMAAVPLRNDGGIDYNYMEKFISFNKQMSSNTLTNLDSVKSSDLNDLSVIKKYSGDKKIYAVLNILDVLPNSIIPGLTKTFKQYYKEKWNLEIADDDIMLSCYSFQRNLNFLQKVHSFQTRNLGVIHIPLSCTSKHPLSTSFIFKLKILPSLFKRLFDFLTIYEWCENKIEISHLDDVDSVSLDSFVHAISPHFVNQPTLSPKNSSLKIFENFYQVLDQYWTYDQRSDTKILFESVFKAFTRVSSNECCNYERMEVLGDSLLKLISTMMLFVCNPDDSEGELCIKRDWAISNKNLFNIGINLGIEKVLNSKPISFGKNWCPPCCIVKSVNFDVCFDEVLLYQYLTDKSIADVVESLLGCCLISSNINQVYEFVLNLQIIIDRQINSKFRNFNSLISYIKDIDFEYELISDLACDIQSVETILNYDFSNKKIIAQALTHTSAIVDKRQDSYEKLELVGDSVVGFLIVMYLYLSHDEWKQDALSPFAISHLLHSLVNNKLLGILAAQNQLLQCFQTKSFHLYEAISTFISTVEGMNSESELLEIPFLGITCISQCLDGAISKSHTVEIIPIPKPAGDLFESIVGAVFIDTGCDIVKTARIFMPFFESHLKQYLNTFPVHPKVYVLENYKDICKSVIKQDDTKFKVTLRRAEEEFDYIGIATNLEDAHSAACYSLMTRNSPGESSNTN